MFLALGAGTFAGVTGGMFHLFTHAFFKALLFLGAGSVMHAMGGVIDMRQFGGLRRLMPYTHWTFLFGCLALAGVFPFAGFWSKDAILARSTTKSTPSSTSLSIARPRSRSSLVRHTSRTAPSASPLSGWSDEPASTPAARIYQWLYYAALS